MIKTKQIEIEYMVCNLCKKEIQPKEKFMMLVLFKTTFNSHSGHIYKEYTQEDRSIDVCESCSKMRILNDLKQEEE